MQYIKKNEKKELVNPYEINVCKNKLKMMNVFVWNERTNEIYGKKNKCNVKRDVFMNAALVQCEMFTERAYKS